MKTLRDEMMEEIDREVMGEPTPIPMVLFCPVCKAQHLDQLEADGTDWAKRLHRKHLCKNTPNGPDTGCGHIWKPSEDYTVGVLKLET